MTDLKLIWTSINWEDMGVTIGCFVFAAFIVFSLWVTARAVRAVGDAARYDREQRDMLVRGGDEWLHKAYAPKNDGYRRLVEPWYYDGVNKPNPCLYEHPSPAQQFLEYRVGADSEKAGNHENNI